MQNVKKNKYLFVNFIVHCKAIHMIVLFIYLHVEIHLVGIHQIGLSLIFPIKFIFISITFSWTAIRCQKLDETVEESIPLDDEPLATVPSSSTDWCDDADAWNSDDDDANNKNEKKSSSISTTIKKEIKKEPEVIMFNSMKIEDENENDKSSSDEDDAIEIETRKKSNIKNISVASSDAFNEWKKNNLTKQTLDTSTNVSFPFYYIVIDDEEDITNQAKFNEKKKLKNKIKNLDDIDEDDDETTKGGKE